MTRYFSLGIFLSWVFVIISFLSFAYAARLALGEYGFYIGFGILAFVVAIMMFSAECLLEIRIDKDEPTYCWWRHLPP
jgi:hypothetical protein